MLAEPRWGRGDSEGGAPAPTGARLEAGGDLRARRGRRPVGSVRPSKLFKLFKSDFRSNDAGERLGVRVRSVDRHAATAAMLGRKLRHHLRAPRHHRWPRIASRRPTTLQSGRVARDQICQVRSFSDRMPADRSVVSSISHPFLRVGCTDQTRRPACDRELIPLYKAQSQGWPLTAHVGSLYAE